MDDWTTDPHGFATTSDETDAELLVLVTALDDLAPAIFILHSDAASANKSS